MTALLQAPLDLGCCRTPTRVELVRDFAGAGVLPPVADSRAKIIPALSDATWKPMSRLLDLLHPVQIEHYCWTFTVVDDHGRPLDVPIDYDPLTQADALPPTGALHEILNALASEGWKVDCVRAENEAGEAVAPGRLEDVDWESLRALRYSLARSGAFKYPVL